MSHLSEKENKLKKNFIAKYTYLSVLCNNNVCTHYIKTDSQRLYVASDIRQFLEHWKELEVVMTLECSFAVANSKASWFPHPPGSNDITYASFNFLILL